MQSTSLNANQVLLALENKRICSLIKFGAFFSQEMDGKSHGMLESLRAPMEEREGVKNNSGLSEMAKGRR